MANRKTKFNRLSIINRWKMESYSRPDSWVIFGIQERWAGVHDMCYKICFFGIDFQFWFKISFDNE